MHIQKAENRNIEFNEAFQRVATSLKPTFIEDIQRPKHIVEVVQDEEAIHGWKSKQIEPATQLNTMDFGKGDSFILDFGAHQVGYLKFKIRPVGSPPDAPLHLRLTFGEMPVETAEPFSEYDGWISSSWLQEETIHVDVLPNMVELPRRYSFRYLKVEVLDTSVKYNVAFDDIYCKTVTSADLSNVIPLHHSDNQLEEIDKVSIKTLQDCMQDVFEDGPKRDRRLWLGDLRLQALANYETVQNNDLVKRCLYLFASAPNDKGQVSANLFIEPSLVPDDTYLFDYSLFFTTTLYDYYRATKDEQALQDLWPLAYRQIELGLERLDENNIVRDDPSWWSFIDWNDDLNKQAPSQGVLLYALKKASKLAEVVDDEKQALIDAKIKEVSEATIEHLWDEKAELFVSGPDRQISWASQVWMVIAGALDKEKSRKLMNHLLERQPSINMNTPYMYHHLVEALIIVGEKEKAITVLKQYWGGMIEYGADTFWELYNPNDKEYSPYGSHLINSYCHAWSCTPTYLLRNYKL